MRARSDTPLEERLQYGAADRAAMLRKFGFIPLSVLKLSRGEMSRSLFNLQGERAKVVRGAESRHRIERTKTEQGRETAEARAALGLFGGVSEARPSGREVGSVMAAELVDFVARYYSRSGKTYLDPFAGHGVRLQVAWQLGMPYVAMDASRTFVDYIERVIVKLRAENDSTELRIVRGDSRHPDEIADGIGDFSFTSPPYWDIEHYGDEPEQLGTLGVSYEAFVASMGDVYRAWLPKFKRGAYVVLNVNDIRRDQRFYAYHSDLIVALTGVGYELHDIWIVDGLVAGLTRAFAVSFNMKRIAPKVHEYLLVFRVP